MTVLGFKMTVSWKPSYPFKFSPEPGKSSWEMEEKEKQSRIARFTSSLAPGAWTPVEFIVPNSKAEQLAQIDVAVDYDTVSLHNPTNPQ
jgi:hypothetical protein